MKALLILLCVALAEAKSYSNYHLLRVRPQTEAQLTTLKLLSAEETGLEIDFWIRPYYLNRTCEFLVSLETYMKIKPILAGVGLKVEILSHDIQKAIDAERTPSGNSTEYGYQLNPNTFMKYSEIVVLMKRYTQVHNHVTLVSYGTSYEKRELYAIRFTTGPGKKTVFVEAGMHAREWIGTASVMKIIERFANDYDSDTDIIHLLSLYDWVFIPCSNPDGYEYTFYQDRMWRKNRKPNNRCMGTDLNRNFDAGWSGEGSSSFECSLTFHGSRALSEPESEALVRFIKSAGPLIGFFSIHSYSQFIMPPYGFTRQKPKDSEELTKLAYKAARAITQATGSYFTVGTPPELLYVAGGGVYDWVKLKHQAKYSYAMELRPKHNTRNGFILSPLNIKPSSVELFAALKTFANGF
ncbi:carboxypeptidase A2-like [Octopus sinensis]|uniref:Carboxypeptidase A2-like n=1 Tax=Octopus sinensis TaxID=2607531 RepID=A0A6P7TNB4_9MOLL|nr:carboxypeptidase A2-like [Octopus sinensis]